MIVHRKARAEKLSPERRKEIARKAAKARWDRKRRVEESCSALLLRGTWFRVINPLKDSKGTAKVRRWKRAALRRWPKKNLAVGV